MVHDPKQITETAFRLTPAFQELLREQKLDTDTISRVSERLEQLRAGLAKRAKAKTVEVKASHVAYMSHPKETAKLIEEAATSAHVN